MQRCVWRNLQCNFEKIMSCIFTERWCLQLCTSYCIRVPHVDGRSPALARTPKCVARVIIAEPHVSLRVGPGRGNVINRLSLFPERALVSSELQFPLRIKRSVTGELVAATG